MVTQLVWWIAIALEALLLFRLVKEKVVGTYPFFFFYITYILSMDVASFYWDRVRPASYAKFYWLTEVFSVVLGYGVLFEIYRRSLRHHPSVARLARNGLLLVLAVAAAKFAVGTFGSSGESWAFGTKELDRNLRYVELALLAVMLVLFSIYRIPAGRNLKGLITGYSFFITMSVVNLAIILQPGNLLSPIVRQLPSVAYLVTLAIWCNALWSPAPEPAVPSERQLERDYLALETRTRATFVRLKTYFVRSFHL